jgi:hypothetical protein
MCLQGEGQEARNKWKTVLKGMEDMQANLLEKLAVRGKYSTTNGHAPCRAAVLHFVEAHFFKLFSRECCRQ